MTNKNFETDDDIESGEWLFRWDNDDGNDIMTIEKSMTRWRKWWQGWWVIKQMMMLRLM